MRSTTFALGLATVVAGAVLTAAPAQAATYGVTLTVSTSTADIGKKVTLTGKVSGKGSAKKSVVIQRKTAKAWKTITTVTTSSKSTYSKAITIRSTGAGVYRVAAKKSGATSTGYSPSRTVTGFRWLWLADQPLLTTGQAFVNTTVRVLEKRYAHSIELSAFTNTSVVEWRLANACDRSDIGAALNNSSLGSEAVSVTTNDGGKTIDAIAGAIQRVEGVSASTRTLGYSIDNPDHNVLLVAPRVHCSVDQLPDPGV